MRVPIVWTLEGDEHDICCEWHCGPLHIHKTVCEDEWFSWRPLYTLYLNDERLGLYDTLAKAQRAVKISLP